MLQGYSEPTVSHEVLQRLLNNTGDAHSDAPVMLTEVYGP